MARTKTTETSSITAAQLADGDLIPVIDVSDTTMSSTGTNKKLAKSQLAEAAGVTAHAAVTSSVHGISAFGATLVDDADAATARSTLGLGTIATQAAGSVAITGGSVTGITDLAVADGGTGGSTAAAALANLTSTTLAADGDILTRSGGSPAAITRANLAADTAFTSRFLPLVNPTVTIDGATKSLDLSVTSANKAALRVFRSDPPAGGTLPEWLTGTIIGYQGNIHTNAWVVISGHMDPVDAEGNYYPALAGGTAKQSMLSVWSDVDSCAVEIRPSSTATGNRCLDFLDTSANVRLAVEYTGQLSWGATSYDATDTTLSRVSAGRLRLGAANGTVNTHLDINSGAAGSAMFRLLINGAESLWIGSGATSQSYIVQGGTTIGRFYSTGRTTLGGADVASATLSVYSPSTTYDVVQIRKFAGSSQKMLHLLNESDQTLHKFDKNGYSITAKTSAPADADLAAGELAYWFDSTNGAAKAMFKGKQANGTVVSGSVALA